MTINPALSFPTKTNAPDANYPYGSARNVSTPGDGTGLPLDQSWVNDFLGLQQQLLDDAGIVPSDVSDVVGACQTYQAMVNIMSPPGTIVTGMYNDTPLNLGLRLLELDGSFILHADYPELTAATYVGDANNTAVATAEGSFYKSSVPAEGLPDINGDYMQLPNIRNRFIRGYDSGRVYGEKQNNGVMRHSHKVSTTDEGGTDFGSVTLSYTIGSTHITIPQAFVGPVSPIYASWGEQAPQENESRPINVMAKFYIRY